MENGSKPSAARGRRKANLKKEFIASIEMHSNCHDLLRTILPVRFSVIFVFYLLPLPLNNFAKQL